jgi:hypothetical protein
LHHYTTTTTTATATAITAITIYQYHLIQRDILFFCFD